MKNSILALSTQLSASRTKKQKARLSLAIARLLEDHPEDVTALVSPMLMRVLRSVSEFDSILDAEDFAVRHKVYGNEGGVPELALGVVFAQNYQKHNDELDEIILQAVIHEVRMMKMDALVSHIAVNSLSWSSEDQTIGE